jgi:hypothetical protein
MSRQSKDNSESKQKLAQAGLETRDTADLEVGATPRAAVQFEGHKFPLKWGGVLDKMRVRFGGNEAPKRGRQH